MTESIIPLRSDISRFSRGTVVSAIQTSALLPSGPSSARNREKHAYRAKCAVFRARRLLFSRFFSDSAWGWLGAFLPITFSTC